MRSRWGGPGRVYFASRKGGRMYMLLDCMAEELLWLSHDSSPHLAVFKKMR